MAAASRRPALTPLHRSTVLVAALFAIAVWREALVTGGPQQQSSHQLTVCHAGSVQAAFAQVEQTFTAQHPDVALKDVSGGSVALLARLAAKLQPCDVYAAADYLDIDLLLKPAGGANYTIVFATGRMVLAYLATDPRSHGIAAAGAFAPPASIPPAVTEWYQILLAPGTRIASSHPFLDPSGYRTHMIARLAEIHYKVPNLANLLLEHVSINAMTSGGGTTSPTLGKDYSFQFTYEHSAAERAKNDPAYRYVTLPDRIDLSNSGYRDLYAHVAVTMPGLGPPGTTPSVSIPASRVAWGVTIPKDSANATQAMEFVRLLLSATGTAALNANGPTPIAPALVSPDDYRHLPKALQSLVTAEPIAPGTHAPLNLLPCRGRRSGSGERDYRDRTGASPARGASESQARTRGGRPPRLPRR